MRRIKCMMQVTIKMFTDEYTTVSEFIEQLIKAELDADAVEEDRLVTVSY